MPAQVFYNGSILPTLVTLLPVLREIFTREKIGIVHGHGAFASLAHDALFAAKLLNLKVCICRCNPYSNALNVNEGFFLFVQTIFTDHSLFGFADASAIITNRFLEISLADITHCICVSNIG